MAKLVVLTELPLLLFTGSTFLTLLAETTAAALSFFLELDVDRELSDDEDAEELELELLEAEPDSEPLESEPESLHDLERLRDGRLLAAEAAAGAALLVASFDDDLREFEAAPRTELLCPLSLLLEVLEQVDMGLAAPLSLFRYTLEDGLTGSVEAKPRGDMGVSFHPLLFLPGPLTRLLMLPLKR